MAIFVFLISVPYFFHPALAFSQNVKDVSPAQTLDTVFQIIQRYHDKKIVESKQSSKEIDYSKLYSKIEEYISIDLIAKHTYGRTFNELSQEQKHEYINLSKTLLQKGMTGEIVKNGLQLPSEFTEKIRNKRAAVTFTLPVSGNISSIMISMRRIDDRWKIFDVNRDGVSMVRNLMHQVRPIIQREGYDGVISKLKELLTSDLPST